MPRKPEIPEYNKPEIEYIRAHFGMKFITEKLHQLCDRCINEPCRLLPITTKGEDCPYFKERPDVPGNE